MTFIAILYYLLTIYTKHTSVMRKIHLTRVHGDNYEERVRLYFIHYLQTCPFFCLYFTGRNIKSDIRHDFINQVQMTWQITP